MKRRSRIAAAVTAGALATASPAAALAQDDMTGVLDDARDSVTEQVQEVQQQDPTNAVTDVLEQGEAALDEAGDAVQENPGAVEDAQQAIEGGAEALQGTDAQDELVDILDEVRRSLEDLFRDEGNVTG